MIHIKSDVGRQAAIAAKTHVAGQGLRSEVGSIGITDNAARMSGQRRRRWPGILPPLSHIWLAQGDSGPAGVWQSSPLNPNQFCTCVSIRNPNSSGASPHWNHMSVCCLLDPVAVGICYIRPIRLPLYLYPPSAGQPAQDCFTPCHQHVCRTTSPAECDAMPETNPSLSQLSLPRWNNAHQLLFSAGSLL